MAKRGEDPSALFRSLRPDNANFQASTTAAAREAELRWPLFKAVSPRKPEPTPALSAQDRLRWSNQERPDTEERKPALSLPGVSNKLAKSLSKMSGRTAATTAARPTVRSEQIEPAEEPPRSPPKAAKKAPAEDRRPLFSRASTADRSDQAEDYSLGLSGKQTETAPPVAIEPEQPTAARGNDSLASIFSRLEGKEKVAGKPAGKRASFLGRLG